MKATAALRMLPLMLLAPIRSRRTVQRPPVGVEHYEPTPLAPSIDQATTKALEVPKGKSVGDSRGAWAPPVLTGCDEPLVVGAPDLRGVWQVHKGPIKGHIERIEQAGDRVVITSGALVHDMFVDGTLSGGVNDVAEGTGDAISVAARFENGRLNLYPADKGVVAVTRYLEGDEMVWRWGPWRNRLRRLSGPGDAA